MSSLAELIVNGIIITLLVGFAVAVLYAHFSDATRYRNFSVLDLTTYDIECVMELPDGWIRNYAANDPVGRSLNWTGFL